MSNLHIGHHIVHFTKSFVELGLVEVIRAITAISVATLIFFI
jgi:hypothetical protein